MKYPYVLQSLISFLSFVSSLFLCEGDTAAPRRNKRKRLDVVPGRSVNAPDTNDTAEIHQAAGPSNAGANDEQSSGSSDSESPDDPELDDLISSEDEWTPAQCKEQYFSNRNVFDSFK